MVENTEHNQLSEIFNQALELNKAERGKFLDEVCLNKPELRERVESLIKSFENNDSFIEKPLIEVAQISPIFEGETVKLENAEQLALINSPKKSAAKTSLFAPHLLRGDLDNIALMALRKEPTRRYASAADFSADISNYLNGLPVTARPNTFFYRASKFYQRNKTASIVGIFLVLSLIVGIIATTWQSIVANRQRDRAEKRFQDVRKLSNSLLFEITPNIENLNGSVKAREILVKRALEYLDSLANESTNDLDLQAELAGAYEKIGELQGNLNKPSLNDFSGAFASYQKAQTIRLELPKTLENEKALAENFRRFSDVIFVQNDISGSLKSTNNALVIYQRLSAENPQLLDLKLAVIQTRLDFGATNSSNNQYTEAIPAFQNAIADLSHLDQNELEVQRLTALGTAQLSNALSWNEKQSEAELEMAKAVKIIGELVAKYPNDTLISRNSFRIYTLASVIYEDVKNEISLEFAQKALDVANQAVEKDSADLLAKSGLASAYSRMGICLVNVEKISSAIENLNKAEALLLNLIATEPENTSYQRGLAVLKIRIGDAQTQQKNYSEALNAYQASAVLHEKIANLDEKNTLARRDQAQSLKNVGLMQLKLNRNEDARMTFQEALAILISLKTQNALGEIDKKMIDEIQTTLQNL